MGENVAVMMRRLRDALLGFCMLVLALLIIAKMEQDRAVQLDGPFQVVDGDTLSTGGRRLRLEGIDAPELGQECERGGIRYDCGAAARLGLQSMIGEASWTCAGDRPDKYGRLLVSCRARDADMAEEMTRQGLVVSEDSYGRAQEEAQLAGRGLWGGAFERPADWRRMRMLEEAQPSAGSVALVLERIGLWLGH
jgi:endonuclease YncB( thermonuclease family)